MNSIDRRLASLKSKLDEEREEATQPIIADLMTLAVMFEKRGRQRAADLLRREIDAVRKGEKLFIDKKLLANSLLENP